MRQKYAFRTSFLSLELPRKNSGTECEKLRAEFPHLRMSFSEVEIAQIRERFKEIDPGTVPKEIDPNSDAETPNSRFAFEYYFLKNLLDT